MCSAGNRTQEPMIHSLCSRPLSISPANKLSDSWGRNLPSDNGDPRATSGHPEEFRVKLGTLYVPGVCSSPMPPTSPKALSNLRAELASLYVPCLLPLGWLRVWGGCTMVSPRWPAPVSLYLASAIAMTIITFRALDSGSWDGEV